MLYFSTYFSIRISLLRAVRVMYLGVLDLSGFRVDGDLHEEDVGRQVVMAVGGGAHEVQTDLAADGLQALRHAARRAERNK